MTLFSAWLAALAALMPGDDDTFRVVTGSKEEPVASVSLSLHEDGSAWISVDDAAKLGVALKKTDKGYFLCSDELCAKIELGNERVRSKGDASSAIALSLMSEIGFQLEVDRQSNKVLLTRRSTEPSPSKLGVGSILPNFSLIDLDGKPVELASFRGKRLAIAAWASW